MISFRTAVVCTLILVLTLVYLDDPSRLHPRSQPVLTEDDLAIALFCATVGPRDLVPPQREGTRPDREPARASFGSRIGLP